MSVTISIALDGDIHKALADVARAFQEHCGIQVASARFQWIPDDAPRDEWKDDPLVGVDLESRRVMLR
jgi:hypothetical protein